jgi:hypothetical protein
MLKGALLWFLNTFKLFLFFVAKKPKEDLTEITTAQRLFDHPV